MNTSLQKKTSEYETYTYDAEWNRLSKTESKAVKSVNETTGEVYMSEALAHTDVVKDYLCNVNELSKWCKINTNCC